MKAVTLIFTIYFVALGIQPCGDALAYFVDKQGHSTITAHIDIGEEADTDDCSPICSCSCCGQSAPSHTSSFDLNATGFAVVPQVRETHFHSYVPENFSTIWQPPKA